MFSRMRDNQIEEGDKDIVGHCIFQLKTFALIIVAQPDTILEYLKEFYKEYCIILNKYDERV